LAVGPSGGGKSTVLDLILRFYTVDSGHILIDAQDIAAVSRNSLRQQIADVGQVVQLFRGSIRGNMAISRSAALVPAKPRSSPPAAIDHGHRYRKTGKRLN
jgi:ABC-type multidrug transport system fused ATPase/permease subunit